MTDLDDLRAKLERATVTEEAANGAFDGDRIMEAAQANEAFLAALKQAAPALLDQAARVEAARSLIQCLIDNEPDDIVADGGVTVLMAWRQDAERWLASATPPAKDDWLTIESAPRDGTLIELADMTTGRWAKLQGVGKMWETPETWCADDHFTHWRPLPTPPTKGLGMDSRRTMSEAFYKFWRDARGQERGHLFRILKGKLKWHSPKPRRAHIRLTVPD